MNFHFATATQIIFGNRSLNRVPEIISDKGKRILLVTGANSDRANPLINILPAKAFVEIFRVNSEPTTDLIEAGVQFARKLKIEVVLAFGGGSVIDAAKAIAAMVPNPGSLMDYLEVIGLGKPLLNPSLPFVAIPTTAGTGAEVTKNAVIKSAEHKVKVSLRSDFMFPDFAVVDPVLAHSMSPALTAATGVDAFTHLLETFVSNQANPFIDQFCRTGLQNISKSLMSAYKNGNDLRAREGMALASMLGGMALANVKLGAVHGFAGPIGGMFPIPHGAVCACLVSSVMKMNIEVMQLQKKDLSKYQEAARILTGNPSAQLNDVIDWTENFISELGIPSLSHYGLAHKHFPELVRKAKNASSMKGNPVELNDDQLTAILGQAL